MAYSTLPELQFLLQSNETPLDSQIPAIRSEIDRIRAELAVSLVTRNEFDEDLRNMEEHLNAHSAILSPIRRIPPEILSEIFSWTSSFERIGTFGAHEVAMPPWDLTHVCRAWRAVARGDSELWSRIRISTRASTSPTLPSYPIEALEAQLSLSHTASLGVEFLVHSTNSEAALPLLETLVLHCDRWKLFTFKSLDMSLIPSLVHIHGRLNRLESLTIIGDDLNDAFNWPSEYTDMFSVAPRLREVRLSDSSMRSFSPRISFPCENVTHLRLYCLSDWFYQTLCKTPSLVECEILACDVPNLSVPVVEIPSLRRLTALTVQKAPLTSFIRAPNLDFLSLSGIIDNVPAFIQDSRCRLTTLRLADIYHGPDTILNLLQCTPTLSNLAITLFDFTATAVEIILAALTISGTSADLCPALTGLFIGFIEQKRFDLLSYRMIGSRFHPQALQGRALRRIWIQAGIFLNEGWVNLEEDHLVEIQRFMEAHTGDTDSES
ncbi:hypothetical protein R3P38DRAFT_2889578 [Favolaschia claudopus]|uniref:F-box domain-containing protein n=1 Tax=Favolaschia claudopus TaxID=2862362 RepID=A0AAW0CTH7_9AGAR